MATCPKTWATEKMLAETEVTLVGVEGMSVVVWATLVEVRVILKLQLGQ
jgi:hypothetical protein